MTHDPWVQVFTGTSVDLVNPKIDQIKWADISASLSKQCRFNGNTKFFYSVAEHSVLVSRMVPPKDAQWGLLHDAAETYIGDISSSLKRVGG